VTKGAFFHHFKSKEDMAVASAAHFGAMAEGAVFACRLPRPRRPAGPAAGLCGFSQEHFARRSFELHLPPRHPGAGGL
jgi:TetR/AcrR family transcriptional repressor of nem operon